MVTLNFQLVFSAGKKYKNFKNDFFPLAHMFIGHIYLILFALLIHYTDMDDYWLLQRHLIYLFREILL